MTRNFATLRTPASFEFFDISSNFYKTITQSQNTPQTVKKSLADLNDVGAK